MSTSSASRRPLDADDPHAWSTSRILRELQSVDPFARALALEAALSSPDLPIADVAVEMLQRETVERNRIDLIRLIGAAGGRRHAKALCRYLRDEAAAIRYVALKSIAAAGDASFLWAHVTGLTDPVIEIRKLCNAVLRKLGPDGVVRVLSSMLASDRPTLRLAAVKAAGTMRGAPATALVREAIRDDDPVVRRLARHALQRIARAELERSRSFIQRVGAEDLGGRGATSPEEAPRDDPSLDDTHPSAPVPPFLQEPPPVK